MTRDADYVFVGAGVAGLSLAFHLVERGLRGRRLVLVDPRTSYENDRTFCFWNVVAHPFEDLVSHRWADWRVRADREIVRGAPGLEYQHLPARAFYDRALARLEETGVELRLGAQVGEVIDEGGRVRVETERGPLRASIAFDSRPAPRPRAEAGEITLLQHFEGWHVRLDDARFEPRVATLMDFRVRQDEGIHFFYVLPYSAREALVEATWFGGRVLGEEQYTAHLVRYMRRELGATSWELLRRERGAIPMSTRVPDPRPSPRVYRLGLAGGMAKPSTGYAFQAIQRFSRELASRLDDEPLPAPPAPRPWRSVTLDRIFLSYLERHPERAPRLFQALFDRVEPALLARFLSDEVSGSECLRVMSALPFAPFTFETFRSARLWLR